MSLLPYKTHTLAYKIATSEMLSLDLAESQKT